MNRRHALTGLTALTATALVTPVSARSAVSKVQTTAGPVTGQVKDGVSVYLGLRYGIARRFQPPVKPEPWTKPFAAVTYGPASPQGSTPDPYGQSEDCLFLNIWTPEANTKKARPVMFYIHGGAYANGSGGSPLYDGTNLALRGDVVVVTVNHRLNAFGYLYLARLERLALGGANVSLLEHTPSALRLQQSGNCGQLDLHLALEWVRDNIRNFGGDPNQVMVFGQSGGGAKIATMMATPSARGLFNRAATMSGQQVTASGPGNATLRATAFLELLGLKPDADGLAKVQTLPVADLVAALKAKDPVIGSGGVYMGPVLDETVLFRHPFWPDAPSQSHDIPMMIGNTRDETRAFLGGDPHNFELTWDELPAKLPPQYRVDIDPYIVIDTYRRLYPDMSPSDVFFAATTAGRSWRGAVEELEARAKAGAVIYAYQADWRSPKDGGKHGAPHTIDIPLVFRTTAVPDSITTDSDDARRIADLFSDAFIAFAKSGSPQTPALPQWLPYTMAGRETMLMDLPPQLALDPRGEERKLFSKVPFIQQGT
ncbi:para-nitrobenzyl esterase [Asticcacaulis biprosthecium C19]|uniref:Carboxylic ester hydrolase n=1 Tax=Asticcacaulis biprosthecium C19 TaxID=715226 RepID=F4QLW5_9CAUL|nr:carboxylesterase/lipase family protein [Asticcacaulis biprosthecium]EGF92384.1 para-nitrobenzyl esterase [Asticcacaulis biprosthecium C19]